MVFASGLPAHKISVPQILYPMQVVGRLNILKGRGNKGGYKDTVRKSMSHVRWVRDKLEKLYEDA